LVHEPLFVAFREEVGDGVEDVLEEGREGGREGREVRREMEPRWHGKRVMGGREGGREGGRAYLQVVVKVVHDHVHLVQAAAHHHLADPHYVGMTQGEEDVDLSQGVHGEALFAGGACVEFHLRGRRLGGREGGREERVRE
jgi:hypothetical protein